MQPSIWIGFDPRETAAYAVCRQSIRNWNRYIPTFGLVLDDLIERDLYCRPTERRFGGADANAGQRVHRAPVRLRNRGLSSP